MGKKLRDKGMALVFTFTILVMLAGFAVGMYEVSISSFQLNESMDLAQKADYYSEVGIQYYMHRLNMMTVQDETTDTMWDFLRVASDYDNGYANPVKCYYGNEGGYFELTYVEGLNVYYEEYQFYIRVKGYAPVDLSFDSASLDGMVGTVYAQSSEYGIKTVGGTKYNISEYEAVVAARVDGGGAYGITTKTNPNVQSSSNNVYAYPDKGIYNAPGLGSPNQLNLDGSVNANTSGSLIDQRMDKIVAEANRRLQAAEDLIDNASLTSRSKSNVPSASNNMFHFPAGNYDWSNVDLDSNTSSRQITFSGGGVGRSSDNPPTENVSSSNRNVVFGDASTFSKMKFNQLRFYGNDWNIRFYPGVYEFRRLYVIGDKNTIFLDTTTGPVYISIPDAWGNRFTMDGNKNAILAFKDKTYSGKDVTGNFDINDEAGTGTADPTYFENYDNKVDTEQASNDKIDYDGRRIAQFFIETKGNSDEEFLVDGNHNLIGGTVIDDGGNGTVGMPTIANTAANGSEVQPKSGGGWELASTNMDTDPVSAESVLMYGGQSMEFKLDGNNNTMIGGYFCNQCGNHSNEFMIRGGNNTFYGAISNAGRIQVSHGSNELHLDTRLFPFPPRPYKGSVRVWYKRKLSG